MNFNMKICFRSQKDDLPKVLICVKTIRESGSGKELTPENFFLKPDTSYNIAYYGREDKNTEGNAKYFSFQSADVMHIDFYC